MRSQKGSNWWLFCSFRIETQRIDSSRVDTIKLEEEEQEAEMRLTREDVRLGWIMNSVRAKSKDLHFWCVLHKISPEAREKRTFRS